MIIFGPWIGEFSYEISWWVPEIRFLRNNQFKDYYAIHIGYIGRGGLYKDFIDEYIPFTTKLHNRIDSPDCHLARCEDDPRSGLQMPIDTLEYFNSIVNDYINKGYVVETYTPMDNPIDSARVQSDDPIGEYLHLYPNGLIDKEVKEELNTFDNDRDTIAINAKLRYRRLPGVKELVIKSDGETWKAENWSNFVDKLINELKVNIVIMGIPSRGQYPGCYDFEENKYLKSYVSEGENSIEYQLAILKNTKCSIYGSSGAATLPFFTNTPMFTQQSREAGHRFKFEWQKKLTEGHRQVKIFDKYRAGELCNSDVQELFDEFKEFYINLR